MDSDTQRRARTIDLDSGQPSALRAEERAEPGYWLVAGLEWPGSGGLAEVAFAVAPEMIPRDGLSRDAYQLLGCSDLYAGKHAFAPFCSPT